MSTQRQRAYHDGLFGSLQQWDEAHEKIVDLSGDAGRAGLLALDQLGHFGSHAADLVADAIEEHHRPGPRRILELGSGYGGVVRHLVDRLGQDPDAPCTGVGVELVEAQARIAPQIAASVGTAGTTIVVGDCHELPLADSTIDVATICGSAAHFPDMQRCFEEAHRCLSDDGLLVITEEVSLRRAGRDPDKEFQRLHPVDVFTFVTPEKRLRQLGRSGFDLTEFRDLTVFGQRLLADRLKALRLFRGTAEQIFGMEEVERLVATLACTIAEYQAGSLAPAIYVARPNGRGGATFRRSRPSLSSRETFTRARDRLARGVVLGQKLVGRGAVEVSATGAEVQLSDGRRVIDFSSYAVNLFGHRHPHVVDAVAACLDRMPTSTRSLCNPMTVEAADRLVESMGALSPPRVWFGLNGSDVVDAALKLARFATGRDTIAAVEGGFHGKSLGALAATWSPRYRGGLEAVLAPAIHLRPTPEALAAAAATTEIAAIIVEPIQGEGGIHPLDPDVVRQWRHDARRLGIVFVADEVQVGFGRCGKPSLSLDAGLEPDAILLGKPLGGGVMPLAALLASEALWDTLQRDPFRHTSTFSGHPLSCAAALGALDLLPDVCVDAERLGADIDRRLGELRGAHPTAITATRGRGLLWGIEAASPQVAGHLLTEVQQSGVLVSPCLGDPAVIRLLPPAVTTAAQLDQAFEILDQAAASVPDGEGSAL